MDSEWLPGFLTFGLKAELEKDKFTRSKFLAVKLALAGYCIWMMRWFEADYLNVLEDAFPRVTDLSRCAICFSLTKLSCVRPVVVDQTQNDLHLSSVPFMSVVCSDAFQI